MVDYVGASESIIQNEIAHHTVIALGSQNGHPYTILPLEIPDSSPNLKINNTGQQLAKTIT